MPEVLLFITKDKVDPFLSILSIPQSSSSILLDLY